MCGISGLVNSSSIDRVETTNSLNHLNKFLRHRGPDGSGIWIDSGGRVGLAHTRLKIIDLEQGNQPMALSEGYVISYNGELYNYKELRTELGEEKFATRSDTEVVLRAYKEWGWECVNRFRGMFAFAIWDPTIQSLFIARDRFGIKPFYYLKNKDRFIFASEPKAILPFMNSVEIDNNGLRDYFNFQFTLPGRTLFKGIEALPPSHFGFFNIHRMELEVKKYWEIQYDLDFDHTEDYFLRRMKEVMNESIELHVRSDVELGAYVSGGLDSSLVAALAKQQVKQPNFKAFTGKFGTDLRFDESSYAKDVCEKNQIEYFDIDITPEDFINNIQDIIYYLDHPIAGPGSFPQYMVSKLASSHLKVVLGGQGGDEIFGGYARYLIAYFEQCIKGAIDGTMDENKYIVSYQSIIPNLRSLSNYKPLIKEFWKDGLFDERDRRYFRLINRANQFGKLIKRELLNPDLAFEEFQQIYWGDNIQDGAYFDNMTHFDFKTLLPALLHIEDRMSMAHGLESRVPILDHKLVELAATVPPKIKFKSGELKRLFKLAFSEHLPPSVLGRKDKMGFPVPLVNWAKTNRKISTFLLDTLSSSEARTRCYFEDGFSPEELVNGESVYGRNLWALLSLELWQTKIKSIEKVQQAPNSDLVIA